MERTESDVRRRLRHAGLRATRARVDVVGALAGLDRPASHKDLCEVLPEMDRTTVFRNLVALADAGVAVRMDLGDRIWRFTLADGHGHQHVHPHFTCTSCGDTVCLDGVEVVADGRTAELLDGSEVQILGTCVTCR